MVAVSTSCPPWKIGGHIFYALFDIMFSNTSTADCSISSVLCLSPGFWNSKFKNRFCSVPDQLSSGALNTTGVGECGRGSASKLLTNTRKGKCPAAPSNPALFTAFYCFSQHPVFASFFLGLCHASCLFPAKNWGLRPFKVKQKPPFFQLLNHASFLCRGPLLMEFQLRCIARGSLFDSRNFLFIYFYY